MYLKMMFSSIEMLNYCFNIVKCFAKYYSVLLIKFSLSFCYVSDKNSLMVTPPPPTLIFDTNHCDFYE